MKISEIGRAVDKARRQNCERFSINTDQMLCFLEDNVGVKEVMPLVKAVMDLFEYIKEQEDDGIEVSSLVIIISQLLKEHLEVVAKLQGIPEIEVEFK